MVSDARAALAVAIEAREAAEQRLAELARKDEGLRRAMLAEQRVQATTVSPTAASAISNRLLHIQRARINIAMLRSAVIAQLEGLKARAAALEADDKEGADDVTDKR